MWYDKYPGVPTRGSPLEAVFVMIMKQRREAELLATRALVLGSAAQTVKDQSALKEALEGYTTYFNAMFPHLAETKDDQKQVMRDALEQHIRHPMRIDVASVRKQRADEAYTKHLQRYKARRVVVPGTPGGMGGTK